MKTEEKELIVLVEDDPDQIKWARKELAGENLLVFESFKSVYRKWIMNEERPQEKWYLITDLFIPNWGKENEETKDLGTEVFELSSRAILEKRSSAPLGTSIVSNAEHHRRDFDLKCRKAIEAFDKIFGNSTFRKFYFNPANMHVYLNVPHYTTDYYSHVLLDDGDIVEKNDYNWKTGKLLKPFRKILNTMRKGATR